jgi:hypothetical protein
VWAFGLVSGGNFVQSILVDDLSFLLQQKIRRMRMVMQMAKDSHEVVVVVGAEMGQELMKWSACLSKGTATYERKIIVTLLSWSHSMVFGVSATVLV